MLIGCNGPTSKQVRKEAKKQRTDYAIKLASKEAYKQTSWKFYMLYYVFCILDSVIINFSFANH